MILGIYKWEEAGIVSSWKDGYPMNTPLKINKRNKEELLKRKQKILALLEEGYDHNYIANELGMRPQNVLAWIRRHDLKVHDDDNNSPIVTPIQQRETLEETTEKIRSEIARIDDLLDEYYDLQKSVMKKKGGTYHRKIVELLRIKKDYLLELVNMWAIPSSIERGIKQVTPSPIKGRNIQINFGHLENEEEKLKKVSEGIVNIIDAIRFGSKDERAVDESTRENR